MSIEYEGIVSAVFCSRRSRFPPTSCVLLHGHASFSNLRFDLLGIGSPYTQRLHQSLALLPEKGNGKSLQQPTNRDPASFDTIPGQHIAPLAAQESVERIDSDTDRKPLQTMVPDYPEEARRERIEGEVQVCFDISRRGYPRRVAVRRSTHKVFERSALKAVRRSTWQPVEGGKELSGIKSCRTFRFYLKPVSKDE